MKVDILASGSKGNCIALQSSQTTILVDAGVPKTYIEKRLLDVGISVDSVKAIFVTHAHSDHVKGLPLAVKYNIPVFASTGEWKSIGDFDSNLKMLAEAGKGIGVHDFYIEPFGTHHDAHEPLGYVITSMNEGVKCSVCLDTGHVDNEMLKAMEYSNIYIIEANHEPNMLEVSKYPPSVKARILSHIGHLSNQQTADALSKLITGHGEQIYLTHLSHSNNMPALAEMTVKRALVKKGFKPDKDYRLQVI